MLANTPLAYTILADGDQKAQKSHQKVKEKEVCISMPTARPLPKKFLTCLEEMQDQLRLIAQRARLALTEMETSPGPYRQVHVLLRDIEAGAYRIAFEMSELDIAESCDECPAAPPQMSAQVHLVLLADELERQAALARQRAGVRCT